MIRVSLINFVRRGGMVHYHTQLANALSDKLDIEVVVAQATYSKSYHQDINMRRVDTGESGRKTLQRLVNPLTWLKMWKLLRNIDADVVHITSPYIWNIFVLFWVGQPIAYTVHDPKPHSGERWWVTKIDQLLRKKANVLFVHGESGKKDLIGQGFASDSVVVVPHGRYELGSKESKKTLKSNQLLFFGRIEDYKGLDTLLQAMPLVWDVHPDWRLVVAGHGDMTEYQKWTGDDRIEIHNEFIPDEDVEQYFLSSRLVVLPYKNATQSGIIPMSAAYSVPVVATSVGAIPEAVIDGETGVLVEPNSPTALAEAIVKLLDSPSDLEGMGKRAYKYSSEAADWDPIAKRHIEAYKML